MTWLTLANKHGVGGQGADPSEVLDAKGARAFPAEVASLPHFSLGPLVLTSCLSQHHFTPALSPG